MIRKADRENHFKQIRERPHFRLIAHPNTQEANSLLELGSLEQLISEIQVRGHGAWFPKWSRDPHSIAVGTDHIEGLYDSPREFASVWRLYTSGQFVHIATLEDDQNGQQGILAEHLDVDQTLKNSLDGYINYQWNVERFAEYFLFVSRLARRCQTEESWRINISLKNAGLRALSVSDPGNAGFWNLYHCEEDVELSRIIDPTVLLLEPGPTCLDCLIEFAARFRYTARTELIQSQLDKYSH